MSINFDYPAQGEDYMAHLVIDRLKMTTKSTLSTIKIDTAPALQLFGVEKPWRDNRRFVSCIPAGNYSLEPFKSRKFGNVWCFVTEGVPRYEAAYPAHWVVRNKNDAVGGLRFACLIHAGNYGADVQGCLAPGTGWMGDNAVSNSRSAMKLLRNFLPAGKAHTAEIRWFPA